MGQIKLTVGSYFCGVAAFFHFVCLQMADFRIEEKVFNNYSSNVLLFTDLCWRHRVGLHCHAGPFAEYMSGFLADDLGTRDCDHSYGDSRGSE